MPYIRRVSRRQLASGLAMRVATPIPAAAADVVTVNELSYRDLQREAKARGISAKQTADQLKKALAEAENG